MNKLTEKQKDDLAIKIFKKVFKKMQSIINDNILEFTVKGSERINSGDFIDIMLNIIALLDVNTILKIARDHKILTGNDLDLDGIFSVYIIHFKDIIDQIKKDIKKERMN